MSIIESESCNGITVITTQSYRVTNYYMYKGSRGFLVACMGITCTYSVPLN